MQLQQLRYFIEVAQTGSISTAAKNLYLSQPSLSQQIINLEKELGISLLIRHSRSVSLSDAGSSSWSTPGGSWVRRSSSPS